MRQLLDTHTLIWFVMGNPKISTPIRDQIENNENMVSIASIWEMAIKQSTGKLSFGIPIETFAVQQIVGNAIEILEIRIEHLKSIL
jgi:PIN domain nuclease of toxin-antitoxin system